MVAKPDFAQLLTLTENQSQVSNKVIGYLRWNNDLLAPASQRYIQSLRKLKQSSKSDISVDPQSEAQNIKNEVFEILLPLLNKQLKDKRFLCETKLTMADVQIYMEVNQIILATHGFSLDTLPEVKRWMESVRDAFKERAGQQTSILDTMDSEYYKIVQKYI